MAKVKKGTKSEDKAPKVILSQSLAVKYRPQSLNGLVGQPHIVTQIKGMQKTGRWPGAFLLEGQTGGGKTTLARILHRILNCELGKACGKCDSCKMNPKSHPDLVNVNAGTDGKIDDMRKLVKSARVSPYNNKRIILIDEAHKLTGAAAEALLVDLEEPSRDTIWVLCTTNPEKMLGTLVNRCVRFTIKPITVDAIISRLGSIAKKEGHDIASTKSGKEALKLIADFTNGSMREAISLLESVLYAIEGGADIDSKDVLAAFIENSEVDLDKASVSMIAALFNNDVKSAIKFIRISGNARGMLSKARWLVDYLIGKSTKSAKFVPYSGRVFDKIAKEKGIKVKLGECLRLQISLVDAEMKMNSCSIDENVLLQTAIARYIFDSED